MNNRAFSILELIIVLVIIAVLLSLAAPSLRGFYSAQLTSNAAAQVVTLARFAQQRAMTEARPYRLHLDVQTQTYWLTAQDGGLFIEPDDDLGRVFELPEDVEAVWLDAELYEVEREFVTFYPSGRTEPAGIRFYGRRDESIDIACDSATGRYRILTDEELAKRPPIEVTDQEKVGRFDDTNDSMFGGRNRR